MHRSDSVVGATIIYEGKRFEALNSYNDSPFKQEEEIIFDEKLKVILHYYSNPVLEEVLKEFLGFEGIKCIEIKTMHFIYLSLYSWHLFCQHITLRRRSNTSRLTPPKKCDIIKKKIY